MAVTATPTNVLALPLAIMVIETGSNEDWVDSIVFLIDSTDPASPQLDLRGITFTMTLRRQPPEHEVILAGSTEDGRLLIGNPPDFGYLIINIPVDVIEVISPGDYVGDIVANDDVNTRRCAEFTITIVEGITRTLSPMTMSG